ncbi:MAG: tetraacyldisaccharide 4'-kinase, partial [Alphaproteobacteria bacterium]|nr:tetraacyldisaccharide 4'-kinase [Alphaproteobacteria bacterium]
MKAPEFWYEKDGSLAASLLAPAAAIYDLASRLTRAGTEPQTCNAKVICVGNLVAGGAGKTPVSLALAVLLPEAETAFLTRGYGGREPGPLRVDADTHSSRDVGDEALLLARAAPTWVSRNRLNGAGAASKSGARIIIMDDGFQNPSLNKDISLVVVDGATGFGNGRVMPAGPLRETIPHGLARADAVVIVGDDTAGTAARIADQAPVFMARLVPDLVAQPLAGRRVLAFAGIGRPQKFFETLRDMGCEIVGTREFADHQPYTPEQIMKICEDAAALDAAPVTTEKDLVRLPAEARAMVTSVP